MVSLLSLWCFNSNYFVLLDVCKHVFPVLFADDSNLFLSGKDADHIEKVMNEELKEIVEWLKVNKLSLNIKKHIILYSLTRMELTQISLLK